MRETPDITLVIYLGSVAYKSSLKNGTVHMNPKKNL